MARAAGTATIGTDTAMGAAFAVTAAAATDAGAPIMVSALFSPCILVGNGWCRSLGRLLVAIRRVASKEINESDYCEYSSRGIGME